MFYRKLISCFFLNFISWSFWLGLNAQQATVPEFNKIGEVYGGDFVFNDVYYLNFNSVKNSVAFTNKELFGFKVLSLDSFRVVFDNRKIKKNRRSTKSRESINFPYKITSNSTGNFVFYDVTTKGKFRLKGKGLNFKDYFLKEIQLLPNNSFSYKNNITLDGLYLKSFVNSDSLTISNAFFDEDNNVYGVNKRLLLQDYIDTQKITTLSKINMGYNDFLNHNIITYDNKPLLYFYNSNRFIVVEDSLNSTEHTIQLPDLDTSWFFDINEFDAFDEDYPIIKVFEMGEKVCFFYRSKPKNEEVRFFLSLYSLKTKTTEKIFEIPKEFCAYQTNPLPVDKYDDEHLLFLRVTKGFYELYTLKL